MLLSMTGYGEARHQGDALSLSIELRALNNRYLKVSLRAPDPYHLLEAEFEKVIRRLVKRGTIQVHLRCEHQAAADDFRINPENVAKSDLEMILGQGRVEFARAGNGNGPEPAATHDRSSH